MDRNSVLLAMLSAIKLSLSARRAWIEMQAILVKVVLLPSLSARRAWIEIYLPLKNDTTNSGRSPQGERG